MAQVPDKLLHAYVEDIVGPITRPAPVQGGFGGGAGRGQRGMFFGQVGGPGGRGPKPSGPPLEVAIKTVPEDMTYSVPEFTVKPGQYVKITLSNPDEMQHNLVFIRPGTLEDVGALVSAMAKALDAAERDYIPSTPDVMIWTKLAEPGETVTLEFIAPTAPGEYPYICTFPGHWRTMQGVMKVAP
jgi:azurin